VPLLLPAYIAGLAIGVAALGIWTAGRFGGPSSIWPLLLLMLLAAVVERGTVLLSGHLAASASLVPMLLAAVALGPIAAMIVGAASMLGDTRPRARWAVYSLSGSLTGGVAGLVALAVTDVLGRDAIAIMAATAAAAVAGQALDAVFCVLTLRVRGTAGLAEVVPIVPTLALSASLYAPLVAGLVLAYERVSPWTLVLFLIPSLAAHRLLVLYRQQRSLAEEITSANAHLRRRDAMLQAVSDAAQRFLETSSFDLAVGRMLAELGTAAEAEHVCVLDGSGETTTVRYRWSAGDASRLPPAGAIAEQGACVPILVGHQQWGLIGFPPRSDGDDWPAAKVEGLRAAAGLLGAALERRRSEEELRARDDQLRQAQKMEAIGRLTGGIAHDFNNMLAAIIGFTHLVLQDFEGDDRQRARLEQILGAGNRAAQLTQQLLALSRQQLLTPETLDLNVVVDELRLLLERLIGEDIELRIVLTPTLGNVKADRGQLEQVILNLAVNARDAMPAGGRLTIETANVDDREEAQVALIVSDSGQGMDESTRARAFDPFFTTKETGKGTGLGLATVHGIVTQSGGSINIRSTPGHGTTFTIELPRIDGSGLAVPASQQPGEDSLHGSETILVVEDEAAVRAFVRDVLQRHGYEVLAAASPHQAIAVAEQHADEIDLLLTDVVMPEMSGPELCETLTASHPTMRTLYMSGYPDEALGQHGVLKEGIPLLGKPFTPAALLRKLREVLETHKKHAVGHGSTPAQRPHPRAATDRKN
jgi:signal transduction histidine kinase/FixJ family two-component response regulator